MAKPISPTLHAALKKKTREVVAKAKAKGAAVKKAPAKGRQKK